VPSFVTRQWKTAYSTDHYDLPFWRSAFALRKGAFSQFFNGNIGNGIQWISLWPPETLYTVLARETAKNRRVVALPRAEKLDYLLSGHSKLAITRTCA
jgi:hypothetical protein